MPAFLAFAEISTAGPVVWPLATMILMMGLPEDSAAMVTRCQYEYAVMQMEGGSLPLDETLKAYEAGMALSRELTAELSAAEKRMQELSGGRVVPMEDAP